MSSRAAASAFRLLGPVEAVADGRPLPIGGPRQRALLALLLLERGRSVATDRLVEELWQGHPPAGAARTLRSYISRLRTVVGKDAIVSRRPGYALQVEPERVDSHRFEQLLRQGEDALSRGAAGIAADRLRAALALWRGPALADVASGGGLALEANRLDELRLVCIEKLIEAELALGHHAELVPELERLVDEHSLRERLSGQLVLALYRSGRQADALAAYRRARELLVEELGLEPSEELKELERAVLRQDLAAVPRAEERHNLPAPTTAFVGRERELGEVADVLRDHRLVTLTGVGGAGKTRLALELARRQAGVWSGGVWLVDLAAVSDPSLVASAAGTTLGAADRPELSAQDALVAELRRLELLLVLDNCEHLAAASGELAEALLRGCPNVRVLATSRVPLGTAGELDYRIDPLPLPPESASVAELERSASVRLFLERGRAVRRELAAVEEGLPIVARICRELDGLPLAIELAAARAKVLSLEDIAGRLGDRFRFLRAWRRVADPRHQTLQATMDWSYDLLSDEERELLRRLSVFAGGFTLEAVAAVCFAGDDDRALELVGRLVEASLVVAEERDGAMRYRLLETIRQFGAEHVAAAGEGEELSRRHAEFFLRLAESAQLSSEADGEERHELVIPEQNNLRTAIDWASDVDIELALRLSVALEHFWVARHPFEGIRRLEALSAEGRNVSAELQARALRVRGGVTFIVGRFDEGTRLYEESLAKFRRLRDERGIADLLGRLAISAFVANEFERARELAEESLRMANRLGLKKVGADALHGLGLVEFAQKYHERGLALLAEAAALAAEGGFTWFRAGTLLALAERALELARWKEAQRWAREALAVAWRIGERQWVIFSLATLVRVAVESGERDRAGRLWGAIEAEETRGPVGQWEREREEYAAAIVARADAAFARAQTLGRSLTLAEAVEYALGGEFADVA